MESNPPAPKKRSLFTKAALSKKTKAVEAEDLIFNRAKELEAERLAEEERQRQKRIERLEKKRSTQSAERKVDTETPPKKRKVSATDEAADGNNSESSSGPEEPEEPTWARRESTISSPGSSRNRPSSSNHQEQNRSPSTTLSARYSKSLQNGKASKDQQGQNAYISVIDSDDSDSPSALPVKTQRNQPISIDDDDDDEVVYVSGEPLLNPEEQDPQFDEDEEFPELVQRARERERLRLLQAANAANSFTEQNHSQDNYDVLATEPKKDTDPSIEILITSRIENTIPLKVKRKLSQRLKEARFAWCDKQNLGQLSSTELKSSIFLIWKRKRLFDYTSCRALGLKSNDLGLSSDDEGVYEGKVHLEAWTEETFNAFQKQEAAARRREELGESEEEELEVQEEVVKVRLVMTARDMEPVKLVVKDNTFIEKLIVAFRQTRSIPDEKEVTLWFDGDKLDPEDAVGDTELGDMDNVEVHIK